MNSEITIASAKRAFKKWRKQRVGLRSRTPDELRKMALVLDRQYGEARTRRELGLCSSILWDWRRAVNGPRKLSPRISGVKGAGNSFKRPTLDFVEVRPSVMPIANTGSVQIEWSRADGTLMKISGTIGVADIERFSGRFLSQAVVAP